MYSLVTLLAGSKPVLVLVPTTADATRSVQIKLRIRDALPGLFDSSHRLKRVRIVSPGV